MSNTHKIKIPKKRLDSALVGTTLRSIGLNRRNHYLAVKMNYDKTLSWIIFEGRGSLKNRFMISEIEYKSQDQISKYTWDLIDNRPITTEDLK